MSRSKFQKTLRQYDRAHKNSIMLNIEEFCTDTFNPSNFWVHVKKLGPKRKNHISIEVKINNIQ